MALVTESALLAFLVARGEANADRYYATLSQLQQQFPDHQSLDNLLDALEARGVVWVSPADREHNEDAWFLNSLKLAEVRQGLQVDAQVRQAETLGYVDVK